MAKEEDRVFREALGDPPNVEGERACVGGGNMMKGPTIKGANPFILDKRRIRNEGPAPGELGEKGKEEIGGSVPHDNVIRGKPVVRSQPFREGVRRDLRVAGDRVKVLDEKFLEARRRAERIDTYAEIEDILLRDIAREETPGFVDPAVSWRV